MIKNINLYLIPAIILIIILGLKDESNKLDGIKIRSTDIPSDMIFVPGDNSISSFYMGRTEECNLNYLIYIEWMQLVYGSDYPKAVIDILPDTTVWSKEFNFNDAFTSDYLRHPAFQFYPVVGVSWINANKYCHWKSDRFNEYILIREGILRYNPNQINEDNFNTEAYLSRQYEGFVRNYIYEKPDTIPVLFRHHILLPSFRLPTEAELEYAATVQSTLKIKSKTLFPKSYFITNWRSQTASKLEYYNLQSYSEKKNFQNVNDFPFNDVLGTDALINLDDNVAEWVYDIDFGDNSKPEYDLINAYTNCSQPSGIYIDSLMPEKDSLGFMPFFYLCDDKIGIPVKVKSIFYGNENPFLNKTIKRKYCGGTNADKGVIQRGSLNQDSSSAKIGFRCAVTIMKNF